MSALPATDAACRQVGDWDLQRPLGRGAMGEVWLGRHRVSGTLGAVKLLRTGGTRAPDLVRTLFARERRAIARLSHPHVVSLHDMGDDWLVTAWVRGLDLSRRLHQPMAPRTAIHMARQLASALAHAHARGVVHRDVKPANVLVDGEDNAWLTDFGIALLSGEALVGSSKAGTPSYAAPEQLAGQEVGPAADQYGLGRTLLAMLIGRKPPMDADEALALLPEALPTDVRTVLARALATEPERRFPSMEALRDALTAIDVGAFPPPALLPLLRDPAPFAWCVGAAGVEAIGPDIERASFRLSDLQAEGLLGPDAVARLRDACGYADLGFDLYGRSGRMGPLTTPDALARASQVVVLLHGFLCERSVWRELATLLCRDHADVLVLVPDLHGFGASRFAEPVALRHASPRGAVLAVEGLRALLGLDAVQALLVGHSMGGAAVLSVGDDELAADSWRLALTPVFPWASRSIRMQLHAGAALLGSLRPVPPLRRWVARRSVEGAPENAAYAPAERRRMADNLVGAPPAPLVAVMRAFAALEPAPAPAQGRCSVVVMEGDPVAPEALVLGSVRALGFGDDRIHRLTGGAHLPQAELDDRPEWTRRNVAALAQIAQELLARMRGLDTAPSVSTLERARVTTEGSIPSQDTTVADPEPGPLVPLQ